MQEIAMLSAPLRRSDRPPSTQGHRACIANLTVVGPFGPRSALALSLSQRLQNSALDDCSALSHVMGFLAARLGIGLVELHRRFAVRFDEQNSVAQVHALLE